MFVVVEDKKEKAEAQRVFEKRIRATLKNQGLRNIGFPSGNHDAILYANGEGQLWCAFDLVTDAEVPRHWNVFGVYDPKRRSQTITVEINIPTDSDSARIAGFFGRDVETGHIYLMHDGSVGGGKAGVGREAFLAWSKSSLVDVSRSGGRVRQGIVIGRIDTDDFSSRIWMFVQQVSDFKAAVRRGDLELPQTKADLDEWDQFKNESSGRRQGRRQSRIDYVSYHGDVVRSLHAERSSRQGANERILNSKLIDLYVRSGNALIEVYEVKTDNDRQSIYTAIGQLLTHSGSPNGSVQRVLVIPQGDLAPDLERCLIALKIDVRRFEIQLADPPAVILF